MKTADHYDPSARFLLTPAGEDYLRRRDAARSEEPAVELDANHQPRAARAARSQRGPR